jgi:hypothetical protein
MAPGGGKDSKLNGSKHSPNLISSQFPREHNTDFVIVSSSCFSSSSFYSMALQSLWAVAAFSVP